MNKQAILAQVINEISSRLAQTKIAADNAHRAAIDDQSVAETQYDTLAIEAAYLAEGQSRRIAEYEHQLAILSKFSVSANDTIAIGALFNLEYDRGEEKLFFLLPCGAGTQINICSQTILVITPDAPLAKELMTKQQDDDFLITISNAKQTGIISAIY